jgi:hypothetical protein
MELVTDGPAAAGIEVVIDDQAIILVPVLDVLPVHDSATGGFLALAGGGRGVHR